MINSLVETLGMETCMHIFMTIVFIYGLCIGSFLNVIIIRHGSDESFAKGRSHCMNCKHTLAWYDNIPLLSYLILGGKCRYCKSKISLQYPIVELLNAILWYVMFKTFGISVEALMYSLMLSGLIVLSFIDEKTFTIPTSICKYLLTISIILSIYRIIMHINLLEFVIGAVACGLFLLMFFLITKGNGLGFGDVVLITCLGLAVGWKAEFVGFIAGCIIAIIVHTLKMKILHRSNKLAFGPYISIGTFIGLLIGENVIELYMSFLEQMIK